MRSAVTALRIAGPGRPVPKCAGDEPLDLLDDSAVVAASDGGRGSLQVPERVGDGGIVRRSDRLAHLAVAGPEQHAHALRRRKRHVERRDLQPRRRLPERLARPRVGPGQQPTQLLGVHCAAQPEARRRRPVPAAGSFTAAGVVVLGAGQALRDVDAVPSLLEVVLLLPKRQLADRDHVLMTDKVAPLAVGKAATPAPGIPDAGV
jgi:hypothetical protein